MTESIQGKEFSSLSQLHKPCQWLRFSFRDVQKCKTRLQGLSCRDPPGVGSALGNVLQLRDLSWVPPVPHRHVATAPKAGEELKVVLLAQNTKIFYLLALSYSSDPACCSGSTQASVVPQATCF